MQTTENHRDDATATVVQRAMMNSEEEDLQSWTESLGQQAMKFTVRRISPKIYRGVQTEGSLATYDDPVSEDTIREQHGGGNYQVVVTRRHTNGKWLYFRTRMVKIPGNPRIDNIVTMDENVSSDIKAIPGEIGGGGLAMSTMQRMVERAQEREDRAKSSSGFDAELLKQLNAPLLAQLSSLERSQLELQRQLAAKDEQVLRAMTQKPESNPFQERILGNMLENESVRLEAMRSRHESEMRQLKEGFKQDLDRVHDAAKEELRVRERQHERELDMIKESTRTSSDAQKIGMDMRIDSLKSDIARLNAENAAHKVEIAELRAKKDKTLPEQADEIMRVQEAFKSLGVGGNKDEDDDSDKPWYERMASRVMENPGAIGELIGGVRSNVAPAQAQQPQLPPPGQPFQTGDGHTYVARPDGKVQRLNPAVRKKAAAAAAAVVAAKEGPRPPDAAELTMALSFMESAAANGTSPEDFAASARAAIPGDVFAYVEKVGIDELLNKANLEPGSILRQQAGRNWARAVVKILLEGG